MATINTYSSLMSYDKTKWCRLGLSRPWPETYRLRSKDIVWSATKQPQPSLNDGHKLYHTNETQVLASTRWRIGIEDVMVVVLKIYVFIQFHKVRSSQPKTKWSELCGKQLKRARINFTQFSVTVDDVSWPLWFESMLHAVMTGV